MGKRSQQIKTTNLSRMLVYVLGHRPDEFGLVPDDDGFVPMTALVQALHEEPDWRHVRKSHIHEVLLSEDRSLFRFEDDRIGAAEIRWEKELSTPESFPPKILFTPVRRKAHPVVMERGLRAPGQQHLVLSFSKDMALRLGMRRDQKPVLLEIMAATAAEKRGAAFFRFGDLFLASEIPPRFIAGPPVSKEILEGAKEKEAKKREEPKPEVLTPGTFPLRSERDPDPSRRAKGKKPKGWKEKARKARRGKEGRRG